jgi:hypothetical protein
MSPYTWRFVSKMDTAKELWVTAEKVGQRAGPKYKRRPAKSCSARSSRFRSYPEPASGLRGRAKAGSMEGPVKMETGIKCFLLAVPFPRAARH